MTDRRFTGEVTAFDSAAGLGEVRGAEGAIYPFHCTQIADGSREITPGSAVSFAVIPGRGGRWEAGDIGPCQSERSDP
ncbi:MAG: hypothetical protein M3R71_04080 [Actinomycetota bacterium]|nr:hypothetical protein [Actinomycetota bacterium]